MLNANWMKLRFEYTCHVIFYSIERNKNAVLLWIEPLFVLLVVFKFATKAALADCLKKKRKKHGTESRLLKKFQTRTKTSMRVQWKKKITEFQLFYIERKKRIYWALSLSLPNFRNVSVVFWNHRCLFRFAICFYLCHFCVGFAYYLL